MLSEAYIQQVIREGLYLVLLVSAPCLLVSLIVGFLLSLLQAATQIQDHTLTFVPKIVAVLVVLIMAGPWIGSQIIRFTEVLFQGVPLIR